MKVDVEQEYSDEGPGNKNLVDHVDNSEDWFSSDKIEETWKNVKTKVKDKIKSSIRIKIEARNASELLSDDEIEALMNLW